MSIVLHQVDSFTDHPFAGNPAGVCILEEFGDEEWLQSVAREMNLSETAFLVPRDDAFLLRWFTPAAEVDLCGHATLAAGHVLWEEGHLAPGEPARFDTRSGRLVATRQGDLIEMDFPAEPPAMCDPPEILASALGSEPSLVARNRLDYLALFESEDELRAISPNFRDLRELGHGAS